jgi:glycerol uptake facilitator-like aquaporin
MFSDTFAGIDPASVPGFLAAQVVGGVLGLLLVRTLYPDVAVAADEVVVPHVDQTREPAERRPR